MGLFGFTPYGFWYRLWAVCLLGVFFQLHPLPQPAQETVALRGNHAAFANFAARTGPVDPNFLMERMILLLEPSEGQQQALDGLAAAQEEPASPFYHRWLTPADYADAFGVSPSAAERIASWLAGRGFRVEQIAANRRMIVFSGTAGQVDATFRTAMAHYALRGRDHIANGADPQIPAALAGQIAGLVGLDDLRSTPQHTPVAAFTAGATHYLAPKDVATIYDIAPLYEQGTRGAGVGIAVLARSNLKPQDIADFRSAFDLGQNAPNVVLNGEDPGTGNAADFEETELDAEWAGAMAPEATIDVVASASTAATDGILLSAEYAVDHTVAPVIALSYSECEADLGGAENAMLRALWEQAAVEGISVVVAAGDAGAAGCDDPTQTEATGGRAVNGFCSTAYDLCVGGTDLADGNGKFWASDNEGSGGSALGYIPEIAWNESASGSGLWAGGGGASTLTARPAWQAGSGAGREVPDVSLSSASHDAYLIWLRGAQVADSGTSAAAQVFAGIAALLVGKDGEGQGNPAPVLGAIANAEPTVFHDVVSGNNSVPGVTGFNAIPGYDQATGWGSVDAARLAEAWPAGSLPQRPPRCEGRGACRPLPIRQRPLPRP